MATITIAGEEGYRRIMRARNRFTAGNIRAEDVCAESREHLETRPYTR